MKDGEAKVEADLAAAGKDINGWRVASFFGDRAFYDGNWLLRAAAAKGGIYGNDAIEAMYPMTRVDVKGETLDGSKHDYTLTFPAGQLPPVNAFWSVTMYDADSFFVANPINRYAISSWMPLRKNADGSIDIYVQRESPGKDKESNWLPAADKAFNVTLRMYWPTDKAPSIIDGTWKPPAVKRAS